MLFGFDRSGLYPLVAHAARGALRWAKIPAAVALLSAAGDVVLDLLQLNLLEASSAACH
jgi:hypothetical protein